jgi:hypothetical protein
MDSMDTIIDVVSAEFAVDKERNSWCARGKQLVDRDELITGVETEEVALIVFRVYEQFLLAVGDSRFNALHVDVR